MWRSSFIIKELSLAFIVKALNFTTRNSSKDLTLQKHTVADVCKINILRFHKINEVAGLQPASSLQMRPQRRCFPVNLWNFEEHLSYRTLPGDYFWLFKYIKVDKNVSRYCNKDIKVLSIQAIFMWLYVNFENGFTCWENLKPTSRKTYQNLRNLKGKYLWWSFVIVKPFFCSSH